MDHLTSALSSVGVGEGLLSLGTLGQFLLLGLLDHGCGDQLVDLMICLLDFLLQDFLDLELVLLLRHLLRAWSLELGNMGELLALNWLRRLMRLCNVRFHGERNYTPSDLHCLRHFRLELDLSLSEDQCTKLRKVVF